MTLMIFLHSKFVHLRINMCYLFCDSKSPTFSLWTQWVYHGLIACKLSYSFLSVSIHTHSKSEELIRVGVQCWMQSNRDTMWRVSLRSDVESRTLLSHSSPHRWVSFGRWSSDAFPSLSHHCSLSQLCHPCRYLKVWSSDSQHCRRAHTPRQWRWATTQSEAGSTRPANLRTKRGNQSFSTKLLFILSKQPTTHYLSFCPSLRWCLCLPWIDCCAALVLAVWWAELKARTSDDDGGIWWRIWNSIQ